MAQSTMRILGHRGGAGNRYPENSIPAFRFGAAAGADVLELDVRMTRDRQVVVAHDAFLDRVSTGSGAISELTARELRSSPLRDPTGKPLPGIVVPLLEEVFAAVPGHPLNIDLKTAEPHLAEAVLRSIASAAAERHVSIASFVPAALEYFRSLAPHIATSAHPGEVRIAIGSWFRGRSPRIAAQRLQIPPRHGPIPLSRPGFIRFLHNHGFAVDYWTINGPTALRRLYRRGADGVVTDDVSWAVSELEHLHEYD
jgi:glycerophosphoryl diester phosphodiesterase